MRAGACFQGRLRRTLLDAADSSGLISDSNLRQQWRTTDAMVRAGASYEAHLRTFCELLEKLDASAALAGTWIEER